MSPSSLNGGQFIVLDQAKVVGRRAHARPSAGADPSCGEAAGRKQKAAASVIVSDVPVEVGLERYHGHLGLTG